jgi:putative flippase GtrA
MRFFATFGELPRYIIVGIIIWCIELSIFYILYYGSLLGLVFANILARIASSFIGFFMHRSFTFAFEGKLNTTRVLSYTVLVLLNIQINTMLLYLMQALVNSPFCKPIADIIVIIGSFLFTKAYVFANKHSIKHKE